MPDMLSEEHRKEIIRDLNKTEDILLKLADIEVDAIPRSLHTKLLTEMCSLWLQYNCILEPSEKWRIDSKVLSTLAEMPHSIPLLMNQVKNDKTINGVH